MGKIKTAYKAAQKAEGDALKYAIECGDHLNLAKENVEEAKSKWKSWCKENFPEIPQTTENLYRRLALVHGNDENIFADCKSIRDAIKKLPKRERKKKDGDQKSDDENSNALLSGGSPDLKELVQNSGVDEIGIALRDADMLDEFTSAAIVKLSPDKVCDALTQVWDRAQIIDLHNHLAHYLNERKAKEEGAPVRDVRRPPLPQPTLS